MASKPSSTKAQDTAATTVEKAGEDDVTFGYQVVVLAGPTGEVEPGPSDVAVQAAVNAGFRPTREPVQGSTTNHPDGLSKIVTWSVPVVRAKAG